MNISHFDDLLQAARQQPEPQRLLLVFATASLPDDASAEQRARFEAGEAGELAPLMCVDKDPQALAGFADLVAEAAQAAAPAEGAAAEAAPWVLVFAAAIAGQGGGPPAEAQVAAALQKMVEAVRSGDVARFIPFDREGQAVQLG